MTWCIQSPMIGIQTSRTSLDFSDSDDQTQDEIRPGPRTGSDRCDSIGIVSEVCDRPVANTVTTKTTKIPWIQMTGNIGPNSAS